MPSSGQGTFIDIFTSHAIDVTELVTTATVTLVGAVHIGALLTAWVALTFVQIVTISAISSQLETCGAATLVGSKGVFTLVSTQAARIMSAFINIFTNPLDAVKDVACLALAAVRTHQINTSMTLTGLLKALTLINVNAAGAFFVQVVPSTTVHRVPLADVRADCVHTDLSSGAWSLDNTFINIDTAAQGVLDEACSTLDFGETTE